MSCVLTFIACPFWGHQLGMSRSPPLPRWSSVEEASPLALHSPQCRIHVKLALMTSCQQSWSEKVSSCWLVLVFFFFFNSNCHLFFLLVVGVGQVKVVGVMVKLEQTLIFFLVYAETQSLRPSVRSFIPCLSQLKRGPQWGSKEPVSAPPHGKDLSWRMRDFENGWSDRIRRVLVNHWFCSMFFKKISLFPCCT